jgi:hypothetical protein
MLSLRLIDVQSAKMALTDMLLNVSSSRALCQIPSISGRV